MSSDRVGPDRTDRWRRLRRGRPLAGERQAVVGGGVGGLAAAAYLGAAGADVTLYERTDRLGGVAGRIEDDGFRFDTGPSWYLMPDVFERFFAHFDRSPDDYYDLVRLDPHYRLLWKAEGAGSGAGDGDAGRAGDGAPGPSDRLDAVGDRAAMRDIFESYEDGAGEAFEAYMAESEHTYRVGMERFVYEDRPRLRDFLDLDVLRSARGLTFLGSMQDHVADYVDHPKLQQLLQYTLVFLGGSPHNTPALYNLMSHVDFDLGVYYPDEGGLYRVVEALADLGREHGVDFETGTPVEHLAPATEGVRVATPGGEHRFDRVVANANPAHVERELLPDGVGRGDDYWRGRTYAPSAFMLYLGVEGEVDPLAHHTIVLPGNWDPHFETIFEDSAWPDDPAYYVNVPSRTDDTVAPEGCHAVVVLVPVAPGLQDDRDVRDWYREKVLEDLATHAGVDLRDRIRVEHVACVDDFAARYNAPEGTALGLAHTLRQTGPLRPGHRGPAEDLYYVGAYTTPGIGVPMCLISAEHAAEAVLTDATPPSGLSERVGSLVP
jgi:phytoene desaturase